MEVDLFCSLIIIIPPRAYNIRIQSMELAENRFCAFLFIAWTVVIPSPRHKNNRRVILMCIHFYISSNYFSIISYCSSRKYAYIANAKKFSTKLNTISKNESRQFLKKCLKRHIGMVLSKRCHIFLIGPIRRYNIVVA